MDVQAAFVQRVREESQKHILVLVCSGVASSVGLCAGVSWISIAYDGEKMFAQADWGWFTNQGLAVGMLIAFGLGVWRVCSWAGINVVVPLKDSAINHLNETNRAMKSNAEATSALTQTMTTLHADVRDIKSKLDYCSSRKD